MLFYIINKERKLLILTKSPANKHFSLNAGLCLSVSFPVLFSRSLLCSRILYGRLVVNSFKVFIRLETPPSRTED